MSDLNTNTLTAEASALFPLLSHFRDDFYMAGGTSLALQIGHRISVDFDLFSDSPIKKTLLKKAEDVFKGKTLKVLVNNSNELTVIIDGVKFTFLHYPFEVILPPREQNPISLMQVKEILATKAYTIGRRGELKDYIDMYIGLSGNHTTLSEVLDIANRKYKDTFNDRLFLEQLVYVDDLEDAPIVMIREEVPTKSEMIGYFSEVVKSIVL